jgi:hypothetical protein
MTGGFRVRGSRDDIAHQVHRAAAAFATRSSEPVGAIVSRIVAEAEAALAQRFG